MRYPQVNMGFNTKLSALDDLGIFPHFRKPPHERLRSLQSFYISLCSKCPHALYMDFPCQSAAVGRLSAPTTPRFCTSEYD